MSSARRRKRLLAIADALHQLEQALRLAARDSRVDLQERHLRQALELFTQLHPAMSVQ